MCSHGVKSYVALNSHIFKCLISDIQKSTHIWIFILNICVHTLINYHVYFCDTVYRKWTARLIGQSQEDVKSNSVHITLNLTKDNIDDDQQHEIDNWDAAECFKWVWPKLEKWFSKFPGLHIFHTTLGFCCASSFLGIFIIIRNCKETLWIWMFTL